MAYDKHFILADDYIEHTDNIVRSITDPFIKRRYIGFVTISAVTAYELAIKDIMIEFAHKKHKVFGAYIESAYNRINGRISITDLRKQHIPPFGDRYIKRFNKRLGEKERLKLRETGRSITSSYGNILTWRNGFVHEGQVGQNASYDEAVKAYRDGKDLIHLLAGTMVK